MDDEFTPQLSLRMVAQWCHFSPSYFSVLFKQHTGKNFIDYLTALRVTKATELLLGTQMKVYEIAHKVGFRDVKHFTKVYNEIQPHC
jgi:two-component system response regulator YesN